MTETDVSPVFEAPPLTCDTHFHVFGPPERYPLAPSARYPAPPAPLENYLKLAGTLGIERFVFVQPSAYGNDNTCMLDALARMNERARGIAQIDENCTDSELEELDHRGVRGIRIHTPPLTKPDPAIVIELVPRIEKFASRLAGSTWVLDFMNPGWLNEALLPTMHAIRMNFIIDHFGLFQAGEGVKQSGFQKLLRLMEGGRCWVKLSSAYRISDSPPDYLDTLPMAQALVDAVPERLLWGSDYPHLWFPHLSSVALFNQLRNMLADETVRRKVLADNPAELFGFGA